MRYLQFLLPVIILLGLMFAIGRLRRQPAAEDSGNGLIIVILVVGAVVAVAALFVTQVLLSG